MLDVSSVCPRFLANENPKADQVVALNLTEIYQNDIASQPIKHSPMALYLYADYAVCCCSILPLSLTIQ